MKWSAKSFLWKVFAVAATSALIASCAVTRGVGLATPTAVATTSVPTSGTPQATLPPTTQRPAGSPKPFVGLMGALPDDFPLLKQWGATTVEYHNAVTPDLIRQGLTAAKANGLYLFIRATGRAEIQTGADKLDVSKVESTTRELFGDVSLAGDTDLLGYWILDEPCHNNKWDVTAQDLDGLYRAVKRVNANLQVIINFGNLTCLTGLLASAPPGLKVADVAMFTVTTKKISDARSGPAGYVAAEDQNAAVVKAYDPTIKIIPQIAVFDSNRTGAAIADADWVKTVGDQVLQAQNFNGVLFYPYEHLVQNVAESIVDHKDDPQYSSAIQNILAQAKNK